MSREIKFRGYVEKIADIGIDVPHEGHFLYGDLVHGNDFDYIVGGLIEATEGYAAFALEWWQNIQQGAAEQFTGLKDANDDDIYENDLVLLDPDDPPYQVIFDEGKFEITGNGVTYDLGEEFMDCEIIGNIHEDKDLLEANK